MTETRALERELHMQTAACARALRQDGLLCGWGEVSKEEGGVRRVRKAVKGRILKGLVGQMKTIIFILKVM